MEIKSGVKIGDWKILCKDNSKKRKYWFCKCKCGKIVSVMESNLITGKSKNCGCNRHISKSVKVKIGEKYGRLTVLRKAPAKNPKDTKAYFECQCDCGNKTITSSAFLRNGICKSCGCIRHEYLKKDIIGKQFGFLTVESFDKMIGNRSYWLCRCECGEVKSIRKDALLAGDYFSCGCKTMSALSSLTEIEIKENIVNNITIKYTKEKYFDDLRNDKTNKVLKFDFAIKEKNKVLGLIEVDGIQHYKSIKFFDKKSSFEDRQYRDLLKNQYCEKNNIPLLRIKYDEFSIKNNFIYKEKIKNFITDITSNI